MIEPVKTLKQTILQLRATREEYQRIKVEADKMPVLAERARELSDSIVKQLEVLDCKSAGNFGYEARIVHLLSDLLSDE